MAVLPSPAPSPSMENMSRKRGRSGSDSSMNSASSPKRAVSEVPSSVSDNGALSPTPVRADSLARLTIKPEDRDINSYMEEQEQGMDAIPTPTYSGVSPQEKLRVIQNLKQMEMHDGETWFVVNHSWYHKWEVACSGRADKEMSVHESTIGPVDNSPISDQDGNLIVAPSEGLTMDYVPQQAWDHFQQWYGKSALPLPRRVILEGISQSTRLELFPLKVAALILTPTEMNTASGSKAHILSLSKKTTMSQLLLQLTEVYPSKLDKPYRFWLLQGYTNIDDKVEADKLCSVAKLREERAKVFPTDDSKRTLADALVESGDAIVLESKVNNEWLITDTPEASRSVTPLFGSGSGQDFFAKLAGPSNRKVALPASEDHVTRGGGFGMRSFSASSKPPGTIGLVNLGNTCFMNSAIQCLSHQPELTEYFLTGLFKEELNPDNPLGMQGAVAEAFGSLLSRLWVKNTNTFSGAYSPREFKQILARFAPQFSGYQQHDSQELLAFLLDGLHEDLNRIIKKPYVEKPEWEGGGEAEMVDLARKSWDGYMLRNDSVIVDLFQGQYQSTLVCPECSKVSITFDPFMYLTLPLPVRKKWRHEIFFIPWDNAKEHVRVPVEVPVHASFKDVKQLLGKWMEAEPNNLLTLEIWSGKFYKNLHDGLAVTEIGNSDVVACFELPCNAQQGRNYQRSDEDAFIMPVFNTKKSMRSTYSLSSNSLFGQPFVMVISPSEEITAKSLYAKVIDRLSRWTVQRRDLYSWQGGSSASDVEHVITMSSASDVVTEIRESGEVVTVEESDITEMSPQVDLPLGESDETPRQLGPKDDIFRLVLHAAASQYSSKTCDKTDPKENPVPWDQRLEETNKDLPNGSASPNSYPVAKISLKEGDWLVCEWDEHMQSYYFGGPVRDLEQALWNHFPAFVHPEYDALLKAQEEQTKRVLNLENCLDEFTKEEQLGEEDLWYCPQCKKHQQATKKFDIWKVPDVLVVHLKRFSSSRILRDKIDTLVDFPLEGLDLELRVGERQLARKMQAEGQDVSALDDLQDPLLYDLFSVTEHMGGLGGGHYRAYAKNHLDGNWYCFDDSTVYKTEPQKAVNSNAYLLFYRRRTTKPVGGKTHEKIALARERAAVAPVGTAGQLPTPPREGSPLPTSRSRRARESTSSMEVIHVEMEDGGYLRNPRPSSPAQSDEGSMDALGFASFGQPKQRRRDSDELSLNSLNSSNEAVGSPHSSQGKADSTVVPGPGPRFRRAMPPIEPAMPHPAFENLEPHGDVDDIDL